MFKYNKITISLCLASATLFSQQILAAGFALNDHSATASGNALAGAAASDQDISFSFWNPSLLTNASEPTLYISGAIVAPKMDVTVNSASDPAGNSLSGDAGDVVSPTLVPAIYYALPVTNDTVLGVSLNVPFGLSGDYENDWAGRYHSAETSVSDIALSFSVANQLTPWLSVGASVQLHSATFKLDSALTDFAGGKSAKGDGYASLEGDDIGAGYSVGFTIEPIRGTRIGAGYRSEVDMTIEGETSYSNVGNTLKGLGVDQAYFYSENTLPSVLSFGFEQRLTDTLTLGATAIKTGWSSMDELRIIFDVGDDNVKQPDSVLTFGFDDAWFYSAGLTYKYSDALILRTGYAQDNSPIKEKFRSARTPDGDRQWLSFGGTYHFSKTFNMTTAYTYVLIDDASVVRDGSLPEDASRGRLNADYETVAHVLSLSVNKAF